MTIIGWSSLWIGSFWGFFLAGFPAETARSWLAGKLGQTLHASVSIDEVHIRWNLDLGLTGLSVANQASDAGVPGDPAPQAFMMKLNSLTLGPTLSSLASFQPEIGFRADTSSGGYVSGSYKSGEVTLFFKDVSSKDFTLAALPLPPTATMNGSGRLKVVTGTGSIDAEVDGVPGGRQRFKVSGGERPGLDGKVKVSVSRSKL